MVIRYFFLLSLLSVISSSLLAQEHTEIGEAFGIDILPAFIALGGGTVAYEEVELIYRANNENSRQLRLKLNINNRPVISNEVVFSESLNLPCGSEVPKMFSNYTPTQNVHIAAGLGKYIPNFGFPLYYGLDVNMGVHRGKVESIHEVCGANDTLLVKSVGENNAFTYMLGVTPVLGTELTLNRLTLIIEFGFAANYNFGKHPYLDAELKEKEVSVSRMDFLLNRFLNDFAIVYRF